MTHPRVVLLALVVLLAGCGREVALRIGPTSLIHDFSELDVRVWREPTCPASAAEAASSDHPGDVIVSRTYFGVANAPAVGAVPSGAHAVTALARDTSCNVAAYGCTPNVDFESASSVDVVWTAVSTPIGCPTGQTCMAGRCQATAADAGD